MSKQQDEMIAIMNAILKAGMEMARKGGFVCGIGFIASSNDDPDAESGPLTKMGRTCNSSISSDTNSSGRVIDGINGTALVSPGKPSKAGDGR